MDNLCAALSKLCADFDLQAKRFPLHYCRGSQSSKHSEQLTAFAGDGGLCTVWLHSGGAPVRNLPLDRSLGLGEQQRWLLSLVGQAPARINTEQAACVIGCQPHDIPVLVSAALLKPLGDPEPNAVKYFCRDEITELCRDRRWLSKVTDTLYRHWRAKNAAKRVSDKAVAACASLAAR